MATNEDHIRGEFTGIKLTVDWEQYVLEHKNMLCKSWLEFFLSQIN